MRLLKLSNVLNDSEDKFVQLYSKLPRYAILSHTWGEEEISFQELQSPTSATYLKQGYIKLIGFAKVALEAGWEYGWMDTCCINKVDLSELSEAINSMFYWYEDSSDCFVYLSDAEQSNLETTDSSTERTRNRWHAPLAACKWFTRGWTLQELIAPKYVTFYSKDWILLGDKKELAEVLSGVTKINFELLKGKRGLRSFTIAERMSWASKRNTTRPEDIAYSLLGIFDIHMPLLYGEGAREAFIRLQEEILKKSNDHTIFGWDRSSTSRPYSLSVLSSSPAYFPTGDDSLLITSTANFSYDRTPYMLTNMGLQIRLPLVRATPDGPKFWAVLDCHAKKTSSSPRCIPLLAVSADEKRFIRMNQALMNVDVMLGMPCMICDIFIEHNMITEVVEPTLRGEVDVEHWWSTDKLEKDNLLLKIAGAAPADKSRSQMTVTRQEIWIFVIALLYMLFHLFPQVLIYGLLSDELGIWYYLNFACTLYLIHQSYSDTLRGLWLAIPYRLSEWSAKMVDTIDTTTSEHKSDSNQSSGSSYRFLIQAAQGMLRSWAGRKNNSLRQWQKAGTVDMFVDHGEEVEVMGMDVMSLSSSIFGTNMLVAIITRFWYGPEEWWKYAWMYAATAMSLNWLYKNMRIPIYKYIDEKYKHLLPEQSWLTQHLFREISTATPRGRYIWRQFFRDRDKKTT